MQIKNIFLLGILALVSYSCQEDVIGETEETMIFPEPTVTFYTTVKGIITDESGNALEDVIINYNSIEVESDENGFFELEGIQGLQDGSLLRFNKDGYFKNYKTIIAELNRENFMRVQMITREVSGEINSSSGGLVSLEGGATINFPDNAFVDESGQSYSGNVRVYGHWFDPSSREFTTSMPGDLRAIDAESQLAQLATFGMMAVELESSSGQKLQLADEKPATLSFPVPTELASEAPATIKTWSLQETVSTSAYWIEEDEAELVDGKYVAEVSHFSFWNCDAPFPVVEIYGKLVDQDGNPLPWYSICITAFANSITGYGWTDNQGGFRGKVPKGEELTFNVKDECGTVIFSQQIGPFTTIVSLGEIVINSNKNISIVGTLVDCDGNPVTNGYARINLDNDYIYYIAETDDNGMFRLDIAKCSGIGAFTVQGFNFDDNTASEIIEFEDEEQEIDLGIISMCEQLDEFIRVKLPNGDIIISTEVESNIFDDRLYLQTEGDSLIEGFIFKLSLDNPSLGDNTDVISLELIVENSNIGAWAYCNDTGVNQAPPCDNITVTITSIGLVGDYVEGEFMGELLYQSSGQVQAIMGAFRIRIDQIADFGSIAGSVWQDENENGIRDAGEPSGQVSRISVIDAGGNFIESFSNVSEYEFRNLIPGVYTIQASLNNPGLTFTLKDQGGDDTVDSDFNESNGVTDQITINSDEDLSDVDLGLKTTDFIECEVEILNGDLCGNGSGSAMIFAFGGSAPYTVEVFYEGALFNTLTIDNNGGSTIADFLEVGFYSALITDSNGTSCDTEFELWEEQLFCELFIQQPNCGISDGLMEVYVGPNVDPNNLSYIWSTGSTEPVITGLGSGTYSVTVVDNASGCTTECLGTLFDSTPPIISGSITASRCGMDNGYIDATASGGNCGYFYEWSNGVVGSSSLTGLAPGLYYLTLSDDCGCSVVEEFLVNDLTLTDAIVGRVWLDSTGVSNNLYDSGDVLWPQFQVNLYDASDLTNAIETTFTDKSGFYAFENLAAGDYVIGAETPDNNVFVTENVGMDDSIDSDVNSTTGYSDTINPGNCVRVDIGLKFD